MDTQQAYEQFRETQEKLHAYNHALSMLFYDSETAAPSDTAEGRGRTMGVLSGVVYELMTGAETKKTVDFLLENKEALTPQQRREAEVFSRSNAFTASIPKDEYVAYQMLVNESESVWRRAKNSNDFRAFAPFLKRIVDCNRRFAGYYKPGEPPYNVLLDRYERGLSMAACDSFFTALREKIVPLIAKIAEKPQPDASFLHRRYPLDKQAALSDWVMGVMGIDRTHCAIGRSEHPFTLEFNKKDVRITTHYYENDPMNALYSTIHEGGHALYELNVGDEYQYTVLGGGASMGVHESQSRLFENLIGRSEAFISILYPELRRLFPDQMAGVTERGLYLAVNRAEPSLIRIEADELTYALHIMVRYELEKALIAETLAVEDLPAAWNGKMKQYLGVEVPDDTRGVLQDCHWSDGNIGYFPSYALGSAYGAQIMAVMGRELNVDGAVRAGSMKPVAGWLTERIYRHGSMYDPKDLLEKCCGAPFDPGYFTDYLEKKYSEIYGL